MKLQLECIFELLCYKSKLLELETQIDHILMWLLLRKQRLQQAHVNFSSISLHIHTAEMKGIQNMQKFWQKCGVVEAADSSLNLLIRLNPIVPDSM